MNEKCIKSKIAVENIKFNIDTVIPCALIINELVSNSLKHAFPKEFRKNISAPEININIRSQVADEYVLIVSDNGIGLPPDFQIDKYESLGLKLVNVLVKQLKGTVQINTEGKTEFTITFRESGRRGKH